MHEPDPTPNHDADLLERIRRDDPGAFDQFVDRFGDRIFGFGVRMCGDREDAREVLQDTLLASYRSLRSLKHPGAMRAWIYRVAANACMMMRRRPKHAPRQEISLDEVMARFREGGQPEIPDVSAMPDEEFARTEIRDAVRRALDALPPHYRVVVVLRDMEELTTREVAEAIGAPVSTVKMRLHRGRLMARRSIEEWIGRPGPGAGNA